MQVWGWEHPHSSRLYDKGIAALLRCSQPQHVVDQISLLVSNYRHSWTEFTKLCVHYDLTWVCSVFCLFFFVLVEISSVKTISFAFTHHPFQRDANVITRPGPLNPDKGLGALKTNTQNQNRRLYPALTLPLASMCSLQPCKSWFESKLHFFPERSRLQINLENEEEAKRQMYHLEGKEWKALWPHYIWSGGHVRCSKNDLP